MQEVQVKRSISRNFLYSIIITIIIGLVNYAYPLLIGLLYGPNFIGKFSSLFFWCTLLAIPISSGISPAISRFIAANTEEESTKIEGIGAKSTLFYIVFILLLMPIIGVFAFDLNAIEILIILIMFSFLVYHYIARFSMQGREEFFTLFKFELISFMLFIPLMTIFGILPYALNWTSLTNVYFFFIPIIVYHLTIDVIFLVKRRNDLSFSRFFKFPTIIKNVLRFASLMALGSIFSFGLTQLQVIISNRYLDDFKVGVLGFWVLVATPFAFIAIALGGLLVPRITKLEKSDENLAEPFVNQMNWIVALIVVPIFGLIFMLIASYPQAIDVITLKKYDTLTYWPLIILLIYQTIGSLLNTPTQALFSSSEKIVVYNPIAAIVYILSVVISWVFLVPRFDIFGFAAGIAIGGFALRITFQIIALIITKRKIGLHIFFIIISDVIIGLGIFGMEWVSHVIIIPIFTSLVIPSVIIGFYLLSKLIKNKKFSNNYEPMKDNKMNVIE